MAGRLVGALRAAGLKRTGGKVGPRIHDLRHELLQHAAERFRSRGARFAARRDPAAIAQAAQMRQIPRRRGIQRPICYPEQEEVDAILAQPDRSTPECAVDPGVPAPIGAVGQERLGRVSNRLPKTDVRLSPPV